LAFRVRRSEPERSNDDVVKAVEEVMSLEVSVLYFSRSLLSSEVSNDDGREVLGM
jgi:CMP-2-keto-3-deoxyoctulosonic acid synthetase